ncbi:MAG: hypothetical protein MUO26_01060 [Methanotrichaceae archaeon]|nr:hypothetical protein [Methanotrichaceae archaeon]
MKLWFVIVAILLIGISAAEEMGGGTDNVAVNSEIAGVATPTTNSISIGNFAFEDQISTETVETAAMTMANEKLGFSWSYRPSSRTSSSGSSYKLAGWKWTQLYPMQQYVNPSNNPVSISPEAFAGAVASAGKTWDLTSAPGRDLNLFADNVIIDSSVPSVANDGKFVHSFTSPLGGTIIAMWRATRQGADLKDADIVYGLNWGWTTDASKAVLVKSLWGVSPSRSLIDLETIALHEMGHTVGLLDLYNDPQYSWDKAQVMNSYSGVKRTLGSGDKTGVQLLYPA